MLCRGNCVNRQCAHKNGGSPPEIQYEQNFAMAIDMHAFTCQINLPSKNSDCDWRECDDVSSSFLRLNIPKSFSDLAVNQHSTVDK